MVTRSSSTQVGTESLSDVTASLQILSGISNTIHTTITAEGL